MPTNFVPMWSGVDAALRQRVAAAINVVAGNGGSIKDLAEPSVTNDALILMLARLVLPVCEGGMGYKSIGVSVIWTGHHNDLGSVNNCKMVKDHSAGAAVDVIRIPNKDTPGQAIHVGTVGTALASTTAFIDDNIRNNTNLSRLGIPGVLCTPERRGEAHAHGITMFIDDATHVHLGVNVPQDRYSVVR